MQEVTYSQITSSVTTGTFLRSDHPYVQAALKLEFALVIYVVFKQQQQLHLRLNILQKEKN